MRWYKFWSTNSGAIGAVILGALIGSIISIFIVLKVKGYL